MPNTLMASRSRPTFLRPRCFPFAGPRLPARRRAAWWAARDYCELRIVATNVWGQLGSGGQIIVSRWKAVHDCRDNAGGVQTEPGRRGCLHLARSGPFAEFAESGP